MIKRSIILSVPLHWNGFVVTCGSTIPRLTFGNSHTTVNYFVREEYTVAGRFENLLVVNSPWAMRQYTAYTITLNFPYCGMDNRYFHVAVLGYIIKLINNYPGFGVRGDVLFTDDL